MSSTTHSEGQLSTVTASSSSLSSPSSSRSQGSTHESTSGILFNFLIVFLSVFGIFMLGGIVLHYVMARRRQLLRAELEDIRQRRLRRQKPEMWDVWADPHAPLESQQKWAALNPFAVQLDARCLEDNAQLLTMAPRPFTARLAMQLTHDVIFNRPLVLPSSATGVKTPTATGADIPTPGTGLQVAVLIAMPSSRRRINLEHDSFMVKGNGESEELREYVIGSTRTYVE